MAAGAATPAIDLVTIAPVTLDVIAPASAAGIDAGLRTAIDTATGPVGLAFIFVYSFLIAFALPGVSEVVLFADLTIEPGWVQTGAIILTSGVGKMIGSVIAFHVGKEAKEAGPVTRMLRRSRFDVIEWSERQTVAIAQKYGYLGLAVALCVPGFPDTLSVYAFAVLEESYVKFALATFVGSIGRLVITLALLEGVIVFA